MSSQFTISPFNIDSNSFRLTKGTETYLEIECNIQIKSEQDNNGEVNPIKTDIAFNDYILIRLVNPFLKAQSDCFKVKVNDTSSSHVVGYIFSSAELSSEDVDKNNFDEYKQAFKFYAIAKILQDYNWSEYDFKSFDKKSSSFFVEDDCAYFIALKTRFNDVHVDLKDYLPNLAVYGYYNYPKHNKPNAYSIVNSENEAYVNDIITKRYLKNRSETMQLNINSSKHFFESNSFIETLYKDFFIKSDNLLYRFLLLYQIVEHFVELETSKKINNIIKDWSQSDTVLFIKKLRDLSDTRSIINSLFNRSSICDEKEEITEALKSFIRTEDSDYEKSSTGDCFYDVRNLLFHNYKNVISKNVDKEVDNLVIQCEFLIHNLIVSLSKEFHSNITNSTRSLSAKSERFANRQRKTIRISNNRREKKK